MASEVQLINATPIKKFIENGLNCKDPLKAFGHDAIEILTEIEFAPAIDPESLRPKGRWEATILEVSERTFRTGAPHCNLCGKQAHRRTPYCPNCGARMEGL